ASFSVAFQTARDQVLQAANVFADTTIDLVGAPTSCFTGQVHRLPDAPQAYGAMITRPKAAPAQSRSTDLDANTAASHPSHWLDFDVLGEGITDGYDRALINMVRCKGAGEDHEWHEASKHACSVFDVG
ncbi:hypothetical protein AB0B92_29885, partial [Streptomyces hygroscopicus]|uniref:hypothetical protein n=1 Tax=Streptomyces hygroscopicus TaxID=1912 RepID=UPI0033FC8A4B